MTRLATIVATMIFATFFGCVSTPEPDSPVGSIRSAQHDPDDYDVSQGTLEVGSLSVVGNVGPRGTSTETWKTYRTGQTFASGFGAFSPPSTDSSIRFRTSSTVPAYSYNSFTVDCTVPASGGTTGSAATLTVPTLVEPGIYDIKQSATKVGVLVVEPKTATQVWQHWVLWTPDYTWPGPNHTDVTNAFVRTAAYTQTDIDALISAHASTYIRGVVTYNGVGP